MLFRSGEDDKNWVEREQSYFRDELTYEKIDLDNDIEEDASY